MSSARSPRPASSQVSRARESGLQRTRSKATAASGPRSARASASPSAVSGMSVRPVWRSVAAPLGLAVAGEPDDRAPRSCRPRRRLRRRRCVVLAHEVIYRSASPSSGEEACACRRRRDPARVAGGPAGVDRVAHRDRHPLRVGGAGDGAREQHARAAELHRQGGVGGGADAGVEDHGHPRSLDDDPDVVGIADARAGADRRAERHHRGAADRLEAAGEDRVVAAVREDREAVVDELLGGVEQLDSRRAAASGRRRSPRA